MQKKIEAKQKNNLFWLFFQISATDVCAKTSWFIRLQGCEFMVYGLGKENSRHHNWICKLSRTLQNWPYRTIQTRRLCSCCNVAVRSSSLTRSTPQIRLSAATSSASFSLQFHDVIETSVSWTKKYILLTLTSLLLLTCSVSAINSSKCERKHKKVIFP